MKKHALALGLLPVIRVMYQTLKNIEWTEMKLVTELRIMKIVSHFLQSMLNRYYNVNDMITYI